MLLGQLVAYAERLERENARREEKDAVVPSGYQMQAIKGFLKLDSSGNLIEVYPTTEGGKKKKDTGRKFPSPSLKKSVNIRAKLLVENAEYVLGIARKEGDAKVPLRHKAFIQELQSCYEETNVDSIRVILSFLQRLEVEKVKKLLWEKFDPSLNLSFDVNGERPFELPVIQEYWRKQTIDKDPSISRSASDLDITKRAPQMLIAESLISGVIGPVMEREPTPIRGSGIPESKQSVMAFISANKHPRLLLFRLERPRSTPMH
jgi:CRISPR-associated protein Csd1